MKTKDIVVLSAPASSLVETKENLLVKLTGAAKDAQSEKKGLYRYGHNKINGKGH